MPATEKTWYDQKLLHVIFGCSSLLMMISTIWMIADDHEREWKIHQRDFRDMQLKEQHGRLRAEKTKRAATVKQAQLAYATAQSELPDETLIAEFKEASGRLAEATGRREYSFAEMDDTLEQLRVQAGTANQALEQYEDGQAALREAYEAVANAADDVRAAAAQQLQQAQDRIPELESALQSAQRDAAKLRTRFFRRLEQITKDAKFAMDKAADQKKLESAKFDAIKAEQGLLYHKELFDQAAAMQEQVDRQHEALRQAVAAQEQATSNRNQLRDLITAMSSAETAAKKALDDALAEENRIANSITELNVDYFSLRTVLGKKLLELPIVDAFNGPLTIDNLWSEGLTMPNGSFGEVRRFDRCTTCHKGIDQTAPGSAVEPAYQRRHEVVVVLQTPETKPGPDQTPEDVYGIVLAREGYVDRNEVTVEYVVANSAAAVAVNVSDSACAAGLREADVIRFVGGDAVHTHADAVRFLMNPVDGWGSTIEVVVDRGVPHPFTSHPRLDLFVGSLSPHKMSIIGCSVCHEGQGSGTSFNYVSHTPNTNEQEDEWRKKYGWFNNHHWIYPMHPARFAESSCLKCHHDVVELTASQKFPDPPAPKLTAGHNLIKAYGCFGCHEINGYKSPTERIGPDLRLEPNYFAAAAELAHDSTFQQLPADQQQLARHLVQHPEDSATRHELLATLTADAEAETPQLSARAHKLAEILGDIETPGTERKAGPSLRHVASKLGPAFLYDWIRDPKHFRPSTKMPQFFGMWDHIQDEPRALEQAQRFEPIEIVGVVRYLLDRSQPMLGEVQPSEGVTAADAQRGKVTFEIRGCLACHQHSAFDDANHGTITAAPRPGVSRQLQGPDLSNLGDKLNLPDTPDGQKWLYTWLRNPQLYHPRTKMPDTFLTKTQLADGTEVDPAADIAAFLLASSNGWHPAQTELDPDAERVNEVAFEYLKGAFFGEDAKRYMAEGIPEEVGQHLKGSEVELVNVGGSRGDMDRKLLNYIGAKTIAKYGCYGCHDIPGFEDAKPIGVALADWGRKDPSKIAFEHIAEYISHGHAGGHGHGEAGDTHSAPDHHGAGAAQDSAAAETEQIDEHFYTHRLNHHDRTGFIWQKLKEPRSYDYKKVLNKSYNEKLRMPKFPFSDVQREQVITFILGLIAEPPAEQFIYRPGEREHALIEGKKVLDKYNCAGCHILETESWEIEYRPGEFEPPFADANAFPFAEPDVSPQALLDSSTPHPQRGTLSSVLEGMPTISHPARSEDTAEPVLLEFDSFDEEWYPVESGAEYDPAAVKRSLTLWKEAAVEGSAMGVGQVLEVAPGALKQRRLAEGGDLTLRLLPRVLEIEKESNSAAKGAEAWGWLPPTLHDEGVKVQPEWLHSFLLDPHEIRPATFMRMPRFNMSPDEATAIVNYFAARDDAAYPYEYIARSSSSRLDELETEYIEKANLEPDNGIQRMRAAMDIVTFKDYCVACHSVADFEPVGTQRAKAPNLARVYKRLRRDYVRQWIAKPTTIVPYTPMPIVIPYAGTPEQLVPQTMFHGTPIEQLDGVVDLLMNYDRYTAGRSTIKEMVKLDATTAASP